MRTPPIDLQHRSMSTKWIPFGKETIYLNSHRNIIQQICAKCGATMTFAALYFHYKKIPLEKLYRKAIIKLRSKEDSLATTKSSLLVKMKANLKTNSYQRYSKMTSSSRI